MNLPAQEGTLADVREGVEGRLRSIHSELTATRQELQQLKREVSQREESWTTERSQMEQDRDLLQRDLQVGTHLSGFDHSVCIIVKQCMHVVQQPHSEQ